MSLSIAGLTCQRGGVSLFADISLHLNPGDALIVTGPNGSGKSSFLRILAGLLFPTHGTLCGFDKCASKDAHSYRQNIHYVGHENGLKLNLSVWDNLYLWRSFDKSAGQKALTYFNLLPFSQTPARLLSSGQRRRIALARLMTEYRPLWILDEPASSLDAVSLQNLCQMMIEHRTQGGIIVVATHTPLLLEHAQTLSFAKTEAA